MANRIFSNPVKSIRWLLNAKLRPLRLYYTAPALSALAAADCRRAPGLADVLMQSRSGAVPADFPQQSCIEEHRRALRADHRPLVAGNPEGTPSYDLNATVADACRNSKAQHACEFLYRLVSQFKPQVVVELGTNVGISAAYIASALKANGTGVLVTLDGSNRRMELARSLHAKLAFENIEHVLGLFSATLKQVVVRHTVIDMAFIDGHHQYQPTIDYFNTLLSSLSANAVVLFDDIRWSAGMKRAWKEICEHERVTLALDLGEMGLCVVNPAEKTCPRCPLRRIEY